MLQFNVCMCVWGLWDGGNQELITEFRLTDADPHDLEFFHRESSSCKLIQTLKQ